MLRNGRARDLTMSASSLAGAASSLSSNGGVALLKGSERILGAEILRKPALTGVVICDETRFVSKPVSVLGRRSRRSRLGVFKGSRREVKTSDWALEQIAPRRNVNVTHGHYCGVMLRESVPGFWKLGPGPGLTRDTHHQMTRALA